MLSMFSWKKIGIRFSVLFLFAALLWQGNGFLVVAADTAKAKKWNFKNFSVVLPSGWIVNEDDKINVVVIISPDEKAVFGLTMMPSEGLNSEQFIKEVMKTMNHFSASKIEEKQGYCIATVERNDGMKGFFLAGTRGDKGDFLIVTGEHADLLSVLRSVKTTEKRPYVDKMLKDIVDQKTNFKKDEVRKRIVVNRKRSKTVIKNEMGVDAKALFKSQKALKEYWDNNIGGKKDPKLEIAVGLQYLKLGNLFGELEDHESAYLFLLTAYLSVKDFSEVDADDLKTIRNHIKIHHDKKKSRNEPSFDELVQEIGLEELAEQCFLGECVFAIEQELEKEFVKGRRSNILNKIFNR
ncbi:MAG: hypothetical protein LBJ00_13305 [Planctomycetaceae bacterium]|nr:hypothetical protein [Planctomycetaceae bacterium]